MIQAVQSIQTRELDAQDPAVIMFTQVVAGSSQNIIPESATLRGTIRFLYEGGEQILEAFRRTAEHVCAAYRTECKLSIILGNSLLSNDPRMASMMRDEAAIVLGREGTVSRHIRTMAGEDFSEYLRFAPGAFAFLGVNKPDAGSVYPHHHPKFTIDEKMLPVGQSCWCAVRSGSLDRAHEGQESSEDVTKGTFPKKWSTGPYAVPSTDRMRSLIANSLFCGANSSRSNKVCFTQ